MTDLSGKTAVITGASRGIGAAVARMLHDRGCNLGLASRSGSDLGLERAVARPCDVRDLDALVELCDATAERFGGIDIVVPNAGVGAYGPFLDLSREHLDEMLDVNLKGTVYTVRAALPHMLGREGDLVTLASEAGRRGLPYEAVYCASKFGQVGLTRALDHELREQRDSLHQRLPRRGRDRLRARGGTRTTARRARRDDERRGRRRSRRVRARATAAPADPRDGAAPLERGLLGLTAPHGGERVAALEHGRRSHDGPVPARHVPAERVGEPGDHVEERADRRRIAQSLPRDSGGVDGLGVRLRQLVGTLRQDLEEGERGAQLGPQRSRPPVCNDGVPDLLTEGVRRDRAVGARSERTLPEN